MKEKDLKKTSDESLENVSGGFSYSCSWNTGGNDTYESISLSERERQVLKSKGCEIEFNTDPYEYYGRYNDNDNDVLSVSKNGQKLDSHGIFEILKEHDKN